MLPKGFVEDIQLGRILLICLPYYPLTAADNGFGTGSPLSLTT